MHLSGRKYDMIMNVAIHQIKSPSLLVFTLGVCVKPKSILIGFKNQTVRKFDICSDVFLTEIACNQQFELKVTKNNFTCIQCADKKRLKNHRNRV